MSNEKPKKPQNRKPSQKQALAQKIMLENVGISAGEAMRQAGYTDSMAKNPAKLTRSQTFISVMEKAGLTDTFLARGHREALKAVELKERQFIDRQGVELIEIGEDSYEYKKGGREKQFKEITSYTPVSDTDIREYFKKIPGAKLIAIEQGYRMKIASFTVPSHAARAKYHELAYKTKGLMAPEKHEIGPLQDATDDEKKTISDILKSL